MKIKAAAVLAAYLMVTGCATIVGDPTQNLPISSTPDGANITIVDEKGAEIFKGTTPTSVSLQKSDGTYWGGKSFNVNIAKEGFDPITIAVTTSANGWYIGGNFIFGGLIGWFIVDPLSGNMYTLSAKEINATLASTSAKLKKDNKNVSIMLLENVPEVLRSKMITVN